MPKRGCNIYKRKDGRWEGRYIKSYSETGKAQYRYLYAKTYSAVKEKLLLARTKHSEKHTLNGDNMIFVELVKKWLSYIEIKVKKSTYSKYVNTLERHILPSIGKCKLKYMSSELLNQFTNTKLLSGKLNGRGGLSAKTVSDMLSIINSVIRFGETKNYIHDGIIKVTYPKCRLKEMRVLTNKEQMKIEEILLNNTDIYKLGVLLCLYTGIRLGEVCGLKWKDISLSDRTLSIQRTVQRIRNTDISTKESKTKIIVDTPKSNCSLRIIPIPNFLIEKLRSFYNANGEAYFLTNEADKHCDPRTCQNYFKLYAKESGIAIANFHSLRHTFATRCVELGFDIKSLSELLGHANVNMTLNCYVHSSFEQKRNNMEKLCLFNANHRHISRHSVTESAT